MARKQLPIAIVALKAKAADLRVIAQRLNMGFIESDVPGDESVTRFTFNIPDGDHMRLLEAVPLEIHAYRGIFEVREE